MYDLREFIRWVCGNVENHRMSSGGYARWTKQNDKNNRDLGINVYGTANAINIYLDSIFKYLNEEEEFVIFPDPVLFPNDI